MTNSQLLLLSASACAKLVLGTIQQSGTYSRLDNHFFNRQVCDHHLQRCVNVLTGEPWWKSRSSSTSYFPVLILFPSAILRLMSLMSLLGVNTLVGGIGVVLELLWILNERTYQVLDSPVYCWVWKAAVSFCLKSDNVRPNLDMGNIQSQVTHAVTCSLGCLMQTHAAEKSGLLVTL